LHHTDDAAEETKSQPIPTGFRKIGDWTVKFSESNGMVMMWVSRAPVEKIKQFVLVASRLSCESDVSLFGFFASARRQNKSRQKKRRARFAEKISTRVKKIGDPVGGDAAFPI
jgi:hypothetical protein